MGSPRSSTSSELSVFFDESGITLQCRTLSLVPLRYEHVGSLYDQFNDEENVRLFKQTYLKSCSSREDLARIILDYHIIRPHAITWTIIEYTTQRPIGWAVLRSSIHDASTAEVSIFLRRARRSERGTECIHHINPLLFEHLGYRTHEFRAGTLKECTGPSGGQLGMSLIGVLSRQLKDVPRSKESDLYVLTKEQWPAVMAAVRALLDATKAGNSTRMPGLAGHYALLK